MRFYSTQKLVFAHACRDLQKIFQLSICSQSGQGQAQLLYNKTVWLHARTKSSPEYIGGVWVGGYGWGGGNDSALKSGAPDVLFLSDSYGQVSLVDKQISGDAANLPVLTNSECDGTAMFCNMWYISVKWKVCHTRVSPQTHATAEKPACAIFYTSAAGVPHAAEWSSECGTTWCSTSR